jgi:hypothetical protein
MKFWQGWRAPARWYDLSQRKMPNFSMALAVNQGRLAISRTTTPPTKAPPLAAPIQSHKQRSGITYGRFRVRPALSFQQRSAFRHTERGQLHTTYSIRHTAYSEIFWPGRVGRQNLCPKPSLSADWFSRGLLALLLGALFNAHLNVMTG